jgi:hypothetical protein
MCKCRYDIGTLHWSNILAWGSASSNLPKISGVRILAVRPHAQWQNGSTAVYPELALEDTQWQNGSTAVYPVHVLRVSDRFART